MKNLLKATAVSALMLFSGNSKVDACTGIRLMAEDGGVIYARTLEWGAFDLKSRLTIVPQGYEFTGLTPEGQNGKVYSGKYGFVGMDLVHKDLIVEGVNEKGLYFAMHYYPNYAEYTDYDKSNAKNTLSAQELPNYVLGNFSSVEDIKNNFKGVDVVGVVEDVIGMVVDSHWMATDKDGNSIVLEYVDGELMIYDAPLGVFTNTPDYNWHITNLSNYVNLSADAHPAKEINGVKVAPTGGGSGLIGLPADYTPTSRFVRAVTWSQMARSFDTASEGIYEIFRIMDDFNVPASSAEGSDLGEGKDLMRSATLWTSAWNLDDLTLNYHTQHNRRVRMLDFKNINFAEIGNDLIRISLDKSKEQDIEEIKPNF